MSGDARLLECNCNFHQYFFIMILFSSSITFWFVPASPLLLISSSTTSLQRQRTTSLRWEDFSFKHAAIYSETKLRDAIIWRVLFICISFPRVTTCEIQSPRLLFCFPSSSSLDVFDLCFEILWRNVRIFQLIVDQYQLWLFYIGDDYPRAFPERSLKIYWAVFYLRLGLYKQQKGCRRCRHLWKKL